MNPKFYSSVILNGTETGIDSSSWVVWFYSSVILNGTEIHLVLLIGYIRFYSSCYIAKVS